MPPPVRAIVFDLDGTLADTLLDIARAANHALATHGFRTLPEKHYRELVGDGARVLIERAAPGAGARAWDELLGTFRRRYLEHLLDTTRPYPGIETLLGALAARELRLAVLSNKPDEATRNVVKGLFPHTPFELVWGERPPVPKKPDPTAALGIARELRLEPSEFLFVGDTAVDIRTAQRAGMPSVAVLWGFRSRAELTATEPTYLIERPEDLLALTS